MRKLQFFFLLFFSFQCLAQQDSIQLELSDRELSEHPAAAVDFLEATAAYDQGQTEDALSSFQKVLISLIPGFGELDPSVSPKGKSLFASSLLKKAFKGKALTFESKYKKTGSLSDLEKALSCHELVFETDRHLLHTGQSIDSKQINELVDQAYSLYEKTNSPSVLLQVFRLVEKSRKVRLLQNLQLPDSGLYANVPGDLVTKLHLQKIALDGSLKNYLSAKGASNEATEEQKYKKKKSTYQNALFDIKKAYPDFYRLMYNESVVTVGEIQNRMSGADEAVVTYFETPKNLYAFVIALNGFRATRIEKNFSPTKMVHQLNSAIKGHTGPDKASACAVYRDMAHLLYQKVVSPLGVLPQRVVIISEGTLAQLPFSALLSEKVDHCEFKDYPFLLRQHQISYHYGADLFAQAAYKTHENYGKFIGFSRNTDLGAISQLMGGTLVRSSTGIGSLLEKETVDASLIHLALPAKTNLKQSNPFYVDLADGKTFDAKNIYDLNLKYAQMVVLDQCDVEDNSEGLVDIIQGFQYAGAQSVISSLWKNEGTTNTEILHSMYSHLRNGITKDAALQTACLELWKEKNNDLTHPVHWATFVAVGDMNAIKKQNWYLYLIGLAPLVAMLYFYRKYIVKKVKNK